MSTGRQLNIRSDKASKLGHSIAQRLHVPIPEPENEPFAVLLATSDAIVGSPILVETRLALERFFDGMHANIWIDEFLEHSMTQPVAFSMSMHAKAPDALDRYGSGRGHPAKLNFGDCLSYAVAKVHDMPLLYKGSDLALTDIKPAFAT